MQGTLTSLNENSGIGRITSRQGIELLVHKSSMDPSRSPVKQGEVVEFRVYYGPHGPIAENVRRLQL
jgi:cold shock CspA family protein